MELNFPYYLSEKIKLDISCESSARQKIHMKYLALFSWYFTMPSAAIVTGDLRVNTYVFKSFVLILMSPVMSSVQMKTCSKIL